MNDLMVEAQRLEQDPRQKSSVDYDTTDSAPTTSRFVMVFVWFSGS